MHEMRHPPDRRLRLGQQRLPPRGSARSPTQTTARSGRAEALAAGGHGFPVHVRKHRAHALAYQRLRDCTADAVTRTGDERGLRAGSKGVFNRLMSVYLPGKQSRHNTFKLRWIKSAYRLHRQVASPYGKTVLVFSSIERG